MKRNLSLIAPVVALIATASICHAAPAKTFGGVALTEAALPEQASALDFLQTLPAPEATTISGIANSGFFAGETVSDHKAEWVDGTLAREGGTLRGLTADTGSGGGAVVNSLFYDLSAGGTATRNIGKINVFSQWQDGRVFHTYDVYTTTDTTPTEPGRPHPISKGLLLFLLLIGIIVAVTIARASRGGGPPTAGGGRRRHRSPHVYWGGGGGGWGGGGFGGGFGGGGGGGGFGGFGGGGGFSGGGAGGRF